MTVYEVPMPAAGSPLTVASTLIQVTAPATLPLEIVGFRLNQTLQLVNAIVRLCFVQMTGPATSSAPTVGQSRSAPVAAPFTALTASSTGFSDGSTTAVPREYFGWNLVSGDFSHREVPDARISIPAGQTYALRLLSNPPGGGIDVAGTLLIGVNF